MKGIAMYISNTVEYGLLAVAYVAKNSKDGYVLRASVSKEYDIPFDYLLKIMTKLVRSNILKSKRGTNGGYCLARAANEITLYDIIKSVGAPMDGIEDVTQYIKKLPVAAKLAKVHKDAIEAEKSVLQKANLSQIIK